MRKSGLTDDSCELKGFIPVLKTPCTAWICVLPDLPHHIQLVSSLTTPQLGKFYLPDNPW